MNADEMQERIEELERLLSDAEDGLGSEVERADAAENRAAEAEGQVATLRQVIESAQESADQLERALGAAL